MSDFPTNITNIKNDWNGTDTKTGHAQHHNDIVDEVVALQTKVGVNSSAVETSLDYLVKNTSSESPGHKHALDGDFIDVDLDGKLDGDLLAYNATSEKWEPNTSDTPNASTTLLGKVKVSTTPSGDPTAVETGDPRVPSQDENDALAGTSGTPSGTNKYVTNDDTEGSGDVVRMSIIDTLGITMTRFARLSDNIVFSNDSQKSTTSGSWTKIKEITLNEDVDLCRVNFVVGYTSQGGIIDYKEAALYLNGELYGDVIDTQPASSTVYSRNFPDGLSSGDKVQIYARKQGSAVVNVYANNMRICYDTDVSTFFNLPTKENLILVDTLDATANS